MTGVPRLAAVLPSHDAWHAWTPPEVELIFAGIEAPWSVVGGWALDLWRGRQTRAHDDLEIAILRQDFPVFRARLKEFQLCQAGDGRVHPLQPATEPHDDIRQIWVLDAKAGCWRLDLLLEPGDADTWVFRREPTIRRARAEMIGLEATGIPYLRPEGVLLYKAKARRPKDQSDFEASAGHLEPAARLWLRTALAQAHPSHAWLGELNEPNAC